MITTYGSVIETRKKDIGIQTLKAVALAYIGSHLADLQNNYEELWNVLHFAVPGCLGDRKEFMGFYANPMKRARQISAAQHIIDQAGFLGALQACFAPKMDNSPPGSVSQN